MQFRCNNPSGIQKNSRIQSRQKRRKTAIFHSNQKIPEQTQWNSFQPKNAGMQPNRLLSIHGIVSDHLMKRKLCHLVATELLSSAKLRHWQAYQGSLEGQRNKDIVYHALKALFHTWALSDHCVIGYMLLTMKSCAVLYSLGRIPKRTWKFRSSLRQILHPEQRGLYFHASHE